MFGRRLTRFLSPKCLQILIPVFIALLIGLRALAFADPPDPTWISGFWDAGDYDDVIIHITSHLGSAETSPDCSVPRPRMLVWVGPTDDESLVTHPFISRFLPRGPPPD